MRRLPAVATCILFLVLKTCDRLPYGTTRFSIKEVNQVIVALERYDADHDLLLRSVNRTSTALVISHAKLPKRR